MKEARTKITLAALLAACVAFTSGFFQTTYQDQQQRGATRQQQDQNTQPGQYSRTTGDQKQPQAYNKASSIVGMNVHNQNNERLGEIKDLVFDLQSERVAYAVLGTGGLMDREKMIAVPINAFTPSADNKHLVLRTDKTKLEAATGFDKNNWPSVTNPSWGAQPFWEKPTGQPAGGLPDKDK